MAPLAKALAVVVASCPLAVPAVAEPSALCPAERGACLAHPPVLLQTHHKVGTPDDSGIVLVPPYAAPPGAERNLSARARHGSLLQHGSTAGNLPSSASAKALENFRLLKELRAAGFTCPGGTYFPPNNGELEFDCRLWKASVGHSLDMGQRNYFSHVTPEGLDPFDRSEPYGLPTFYENLAAGGVNAVNTLEQWKKSDGHCKNMMKADHNRMAVGYAYVASSTYKHYWTQLFVKDDGAVFRSCYTGGVDPTPAPTPAPICEDVAETASCQHWAGIGYCGQGHQYQSYMQGNCKLSCGFCGGSGGTPAPTPAPTSAPTPAPSSGSTDGTCEDSQSSCSAWAGSGFCDASSQYATYMEDNCKLSCGLCGGSDGSDSGDAACGDADSHCSHWAAIGYCEDGSEYAPYMRSSCKQSCGLCR